MMNKTWQIKHISDEQCMDAARFSRDSEIGEGCTLDYLVEITGAPMKVCLGKLEAMISKGKMDCGVSVRTAWWVDY